MASDEQTGLARQEPGAHEERGESDRGPRAPFWDSLRSDIRFGLRTLRRSPGYTCAAVGVLALGIGANTAIFSVISGVLLAPLPFRHGEQLMLIQQSAPLAQITDAAVSIPELAAYRQRLHGLRDLVEYHSMSFTLLDRGEPSRVDTGVVSANFFAMLGIDPAIGRTFAAHDDDHGAEAVLVLGHAYWQRRFGGDPNVLGKVVEMNNRPHTIVGVLPDFPQYPRENDVYMPTSACPFRDQAGQTLPSGWRSFAGLRVFGRLAEGTTREQASAEVAGVSATFAHDHPEDYRRVKDLVGRVEPLQETLVRDARPMLLALSGTTLLVLLIACANVANLSLARTARRTRELAVRTALGAGRGRLFAQLMTESLLVASAGGVLGVLVAWRAQAMLVGFVGRFTSRTGQIAIDGRVLAFAFATALLTGVVFGAAPALAARRNLAQSVREGGAQSGEGAGRHRLRAGLVVAQVAVSFVLLVGAALLLESFQRLAAVKLGYDLEHVLTAAIYGNFTSMSSNDDALRIQSSILERLRHSPQVVAAAVTSSVPLSNISPGIRTVRIEGDSGAAASLQADPNVASEGYFETLGVPLLAGRAFREADNENAPRVAVINASMARLWHGSEPLGGRFRLEDDGGMSMSMGDTASPWLTVIGIVADFKLYQVDHEVEPQFYTTYRQGPMNAMSTGRMLARTLDNPYSLIPTIKAAVHGVESRTPVEELQTLADLRSNHLAAPRLTAALVAAFAAVALLVTLSGIAGVIGTSVSQRTREIGVRMALGASRASVLRLVLGEGLGLVALGLLLGLGGAFAFGRLITQYLYDTRPTDVATYAAVAGAFVVAALLATVAPARRATTVAPQIAFKTD